MKCQECNSATVKGLKFCFHHKLTNLKTMRISGFLQNIPKEDRPEREVDIPQRGYFVHCLDGVWR